MSTNCLPNLICLIGIDGSGKTTLAKAFVEEASRRGLAYRYVWGNAQPIFLRPLRAFVHLTVLRGADVQEDNNHYQKMKDQASSRHPFLSWVYRRILMFDYMIWLFCQVKLPLSYGKKIVCDRYIFDVAINLHFLNRKDFSDIARTIRSLLKYFPVPVLLYVVDVPIPVAFERKKDIPSPDFLKEREKIYQRLAKLFNAKRLDGTQPVADLVAKILEEL